MTIKIGRLTAAVMLVAVGSVLLFDRWQGTAYLGVLLEWWPLLLVLLGLEYLYYGSRGHGEGVRMKLDIASVIGAVVLSAVIGTVTNWSSLWQFDNWLEKSVTVNLPFGDVETIFGDTANWKKVEKDVTNIRLPAGNEKVSFYNTNGKITVRTGDVEEIQVGMLVAAAVASEDEASKIADGTKLEVTEGSALAITVKGYRYGKGDRREPSVDLDITVPEQHNATWEFQSKNGDITLQGLNGSAKAITFNGDIAVSSVRGAVDASTTNGDVSVTGSTGDIEARTTLGDIRLEQVQRKLQAKTTNGDIDVTAERIGGDWNVDTTLGDVTVDIPSAGDYRLKAQTNLGDVEADADDDSVLSDFTVQTHSIEGKRGGGTYEIDANTQGDFNVTFR